MFVLCLAGLGKRFTEAGIHTPKYLLPTSKKTTILCKIVQELNMPLSQKLLLILNKRHQKYHFQIQRTLKNLGVDFYLYYVSDTQGQAENAKIASEIIIQDFAYLADEPFIIHNGDTLLLNRKVDSFLSALKCSDGLIDTFPSNKPCYSYVMCHNDKVISIKEKHVISDYASTGLYGFKSARYYLQSYTKTAFSGEQYISEVYSYLVKNNAKILNKYSANLKTLSF